MQNDLLTPVPTGKVYKISHIIIGSFFGGLFAAAFLLAGNFKALGQKQKVFSTWIYAIILFLLLGATAFVPELDQVPGILYTIIVTAIIAAYAHAQQKQQVEEHIANGGATHPGGRVVVITIVGILLMAAFVLGAYWLSDLYVNDIEGQY